MEGIIKVSTCSSVWSWIPSWRYWNYYRTQNVTQHDAATRFRSSISSERSEFEWYQVTRRVFLCRRKNTINSTQDRRRRRCGGTLATRSAVTKRRAIDGGRVEPMKTDREAGLALARCHHGCCRLNSYVYEIWIQTCRNDASIILWGSLNGCQLWNSSRFKHRFFINTRQIWL